MKDYTQPPTDTDKNGKTEAEANQDKSLFDNSWEAWVFVGVIIIAIVTSLCLLFNGIYQLFILIL